MAELADGQVQRDAEHFVTLFDINFLPLGLTLYRSLREHLPGAQLWVVCLDEQVEFSLRKLALPGLHLIPLPAIENAALLDVKPTRTRAEYCWTLTSFTMEAVFARDEQVRRVTYLDADLYFFDSPQPLLQEFERSGKHVLITEHAYAPEYDQTETSGRFCVQFLTATRSEAALEVIHWWQARCLECCSEVPIDGKFGDQKYLDDWPGLFGDVVHIDSTPSRTLAPWNVSRFCQGSDAEPMPVFFHFHGLRLFEGGRCRLYSGYRIPDAAFNIYQEYLTALTKSFEQLADQEIHLAYPPLTRTPVEIARRMKRKWKQTEGWLRLEKVPF